VTKLSFGSTGKPKNEASFCSGRGDEASLRFAIEKPNNEAKLCFSVMRPRT